MKNIFRLSAVIAFIALIAGGCQKMDRPKLGDYPKDTNPPNGPLRFYVAFDGTTTNTLMNAVDSIRANFPAVNPFTSIDAVHGKGVQGVNQKAIKYGSANDFAGSKSFTIAFWEKNTVPTGGSPQFVFSLASKDYWHQSGLFLLIDHDGAGSTSTNAVVKLAIQDYWLEWTGDNGTIKMPGNLLNNQWHHLAFVYDQTTSKVTYYIDGQALTGVPAKLTDVKDNINTTVAKGPLNIKNTYGFVLGGWNKHADLGNDAPTDGWIQSWQGGLDQFRLYNKALSASDVKALYDSKL
jgi:hypothetical protein